MHLYKEQLQLLCNKHVSFHTWMAGKSRKRYDWKTIGLVYFLGSSIAKAPEHMCQGRSTPYIGDTLPIQSDAGFTTGPNVVF